MTAAVLDRPALDRPVRAPLGRLLVSELRWILRRPRTIIAIVLLSLVPVLIGVGTVIAGNAGVGPGGDGSGSLFTILIGNGFVLPVLSLTLLLAMLLPLLGAMSAADALASPTTARCVGCSSPRSAGLACSASRRSASARSCSSRPWPSRWSA
jgi:ABC-2 type transport system permease protein